MAENKHRMTVIAINYPEREDAYKAQFIKNRVNEYSRYFDVNVLVWAPSVEKEYIFDGVKVLFGNEAGITGNLEAVSPHIIVVHAPNGRRDCLRSVLQYSKDNNIPVAAVLHGAEVIDRLRFRFYENDSLKRLLSNSREGLKHYFTGLGANREFLKGADLVMSPSIWMRRVAEKSLGLKLNNVEYVPTCIDGDLFRDESAERARAILSVRT